MKNMNDGLTMKGEVEFILTKPDGTQVREKQNLIVNTGKNFAASALINTSSSPFTHMAIGTGTTPAALTDTTLGAQLVRQAFTSSNVTANVVTMSTTYAAGAGTGSITEAGIFNASSGGTMLSRVVFPVVSKGAADSLTINWTVTVG